MRNTLKHIMGSLLIIVFGGFVLAGCSNPLEKNTKAGLQVITNDVPSTVFLNGQYLEKTPLIEKEIKPGEYSVKIQPDDSSLVPYETHVTLRKGLLTVITWKPGTRPETSGGVIYEMEPLKNKNQSEVSFVTIPDGAIITLQGKDKEFSPIIFPDVQPGHTEFEVVLPSYETQKHTINVVQGFRMLVNIKLAKLDNEAQDSAASPSTSISPNATGSAQPTPQTKQASQSAQLTSGPAVKILPTGFFKDGKEVLRVRDAPSAAGKEIGFAAVGSTYPYNAKTQSSWHAILFNGVEGWISIEYSQLVQ